MNFMISYNTHFTKKKKKKKEYKAQLADIFAACISWKS